MSTKLDVLVEQAHTLLEQIQLKPNLDDIATLGALTDSMARVFSGMTEDDEEMANIDD